MRQEVGDSISRHWASVRAADWAETASLVEFSDISSPFRSWLLSGQRRSWHHKSGHWVQQFTGLEYARR